MAGKPQREKPKRDIQIYMDADVRAVLTAMLCNSPFGARSFSRLFESIVLLAEQMYVEEGSREFCSRCCEAAAARLQRAAKDGRPPARSKAHLTIDRHACAFIDMLCRTHKALFASRSDVANALAHQAARRCSSERQARYLARRLKQAASMR